MTVYFSLLAFLFPGTGALTGLPLFYAAVAHAHPVYISEESHTLRLTFHHPGNHDQHEQALDPSHAHRHDLFDRVLSVSKNGKVSHTDHVIELPAFEAGDFATSKKGILKAKTMIAPQTFPSSAASPISTVSPPVPPGLHVLPGPIRTTILII